MIVLDASVLVAHFDGADAHHADADRLLAAADDDLAASPLSLAEILVAPTRDGRTESVQTALRALGIRAVPFPPDLPVRLAQLRVDTGLKMPDCCVLLAAEETGAAVATFDRQLVVAASRQGLQVHGH